ncbi:MAG: hypothetical protein AW10_00145 [Candidatus Accumulibacter appositus]|uniref:Uncharacterized protein n=1 Tax=Candidatus Accumulibacter appositus TaxID=1454003 RepID=A0A011P5Q7_9PROT|nr:MAG: hypothetical protein AW10_00145 [Candidatus Accumulibacter appositus]
MPRRRQAATTVCPEQGLLGLVGTAGDAGRRAKAAHLLQRLGIGERVECRWRRRAERIARRQGEGRQITPLRVLGGEEGWAGGAPLANRRTAVVGDEIAVAVSSADGQDRVGDLLAESDARRPGCPFRNAGEAGLEGCVEARALRRVELGEHAVRGLGDGRTDRNRAIDSALHQIGGSSFDGGQSIEDGEALDGEHAGRHGRIGHIPLDSFESNGIPVEHGIAVRGGDAGQGTRHAQRVTGGIGDGEAEQVVAFDQSDVGELEAAGLASQRRQALSAKGDNCPGRSLAA